jgi:putative restriction endonuclease
VRYWWVNQNQTYRQEQEGGYLWSPKRNKGDRKNPFYETMREVSPGDLVFAFKDTFVASNGVAQSYCWESPKPTEFGTAGDYWTDVGWKVKVQFTPLDHRLRPKEHMPVLRPLLPDKYAPLQPNGNGIQSVYLTELPARLT